MHVVGPCVAADFRRAERVGGIRESFAIDNRDAPLLSMVLPRGHNAAQFAGRNPARFKAGLSCDRGEASRKLRIGRYVDLSASTRTGLS